MIEDLLFLGCSWLGSQKLMELAELHGIRTPEGIRIDLRLTQGELAAMVGASRESVNKVMGYFTDKRFISTDKYKITIIRLAELRLRVYSSEENYALMQRYPDAPKSQEEIAPSDGNVSDQITVRVPASELPRQLADGLDVSATDMPRPQPIGLPTIEPMGGFHTRRASSTPDGWCRSRSCREGESSTRC